MITLFDLHGKIVITTGASSGLEEQFAHIFCYQKGIVSPGDFALVIMTNFIAYPNKKLTSFRSYLIRAK